MVCALCFSVCFDSVKDFLTSLIRFRLEGETHLNLSLKRSVMSIRACPVEKAYGRCPLISCSSSHETFCGYEERLGFCSFKNCNLRHKNAVNANSVPTLCKSWQEGNCHAWRCKDRHYYTDDDEVLPQAKRFLEVDDGSSRQTPFSSPYCVRIQKEVIKKRKVEVDLETGRVFHRIIRKAFVQW